MMQDFPGGLDGKASVYSVRDLGLIPGLGRFPGEGNGNPLQYFLPWKFLGWRSLVQATIHGVAKSWARLSDFTFFLCWHVRWVQLCGSLNILWHCLSLGLEWKLTFFQSCDHCCNKGLFSQNYGFSSSVRISEPVKLLSHVQLFVTPWTVAYQAPPSMKFSKQEYWNGLPFPSPGDLPNPGIKPRSPTLQADALLSELQGKPQCYCHC